MQSILVIVVLSHMLETDDIFTSGSIWFVVYPVTSCQRDCHSQVLSRQCVQGGPSRLSASRHGLLICLARLTLFCNHTGARAVFGNIARFPSQDYQEVLYNANIFALHTLCVDRMQVENLI